MSSNSNPTSEKVSRFVTEVSNLVGIGTPVPEQYRALIESLHASGYSVWGAANHVKKVLQINSMETF